MIGSVELDDYVDKLKMCSLAMPDYQRIAYIKCSRV